MSDRILKSAITIGAWRWSRTAQRASDLETTDFTQALLNFGYEVLKVNPTVDATNKTEVSTWIETLLEGGDVKLAAAGMSDFLSGMVGRTEKIKALEYGDQLMDAAAGIQDSALRAMVLRSDTLSELVNLGGAYAALNPSKNLSDNQTFLAEAWSSSENSRIERSGQSLQKMMQGMTPEIQRDWFVTERRIFQSVLKIGNKQSVTKIDNPYYDLHPINNLLDEYEVVSQLDLINKTKEIDKNEDDFAPSNQPEQLRKGNFAHKFIGSGYMAVHGETDAIYLNYYPISTILSTFSQREYPINRNAITIEESRKKPDILNVDRQLIYEIKPSHRQLSAVKQAQQYIDIFQRAGVNIRMGPMNEAGTFGALKYGKGTILYATPENGVILYQYVENLDRNGRVIEYETAQQYLEAMRNATGIAIGIALIWTLMTSSTQGGGNVRYGR